MSIESRIRRLERELAPELAEVRARHMTKCSYVIVHTAYAPRGQARVTTTRPCAQGVYKDGLCWHHQPGKILRYPYGEPVETMEEPLP